MRYMQYVGLALFLPSICLGAINLDVDKNGATDVNRGGSNATTAAGARSNLGLGNVTNTSDANKPVSTTQQSALDLKSNITCFVDASAFNTCFGLDWITAAGISLGTTDNVTFGNVTASGGTLTVGVGGITQGALVLKTNTDPINSFGITPAASPSAIVSLKAPGAMPSADNSMFNCDINGTCDWTAPATFLTPTGVGGALTFTASGFNGNLATTDNTLQELADAVDNLTVGAGADDQTASEVNITDAGLYFTGTTVEAALQEVGLDYAKKANYLSVANTTTFTPDADYEPATKKYVDDTVTAGGSYTDEMAQDATGGMFTGNTETGITITYDDATAKINATVATQFDGSQNTSGSAGSIGGVVTASGITGALNLTKTGTTARTVTFQDVAGTVALTSDIVTAPTDATISTTDVTTNNASTSKHGWLVKGTAPASGLRNVVAIDNGETAYTNKALFDATSPSTQAFGDAASAGTAMSAARRDHKHAMPAAPTTVSGTSGGLSGTPNITVGTISAGAAGFTVDADGDLIAKSIGTTRATTTGSIFDLYEGSNNGDNKVTIQPSAALSADKNIVAENILQTTDTSIFQASDADLTSASGASSAGVSKYWGTNASSVVGFYDLPSGVGTPTTITVVDTTDTTSYVALFTDATGDLGPKTDAGLTYNAGTGMLTATGFTGPLTGTASGNLVSGGAAGTPSSITLTNGTGLPISGLTNSTSAALGLGSVELGHASDTTIARSGPGVVTVEGVTVTRTIASGTAALGTSAIGSGACATAVSATATGTATTDTIGWGFNGDPTSTTGYTATANGMLTIVAYPTSGNVNFKVCNNTAASVTPGAVTLNWKVLR